MTDPATPQTPRRKGQLDEEGARWFARMRGPEADASRPEFERWLARGALHRAAYNRAGELWSIGKFLTEPRSPDETDSVSGPDWPAEPDRTTARGTRWRRMRAMLLAAMLVGALGLAGWAVPTLRQMLPLDQGAGDTPIAHGSDQQGAPAYETIAGETRTIRLADGSTVTLRPLGRLTVSFDSRQRQLRLERGSARFDVAHEARSFVVAAGRGSVTAHGTMFDVSFADADRIMVKLVRGSVSVALPNRDRNGNEPAAIRWLSPGEAVSFATPALPSPATFDPVSDGGSEATEFEEARLADVINSANVGSSFRLRIDPSLADLRVSGRFRTADRRQLAANIAATLGLQVRAISPQEVVLTRD